MENTPPSNCLKMWGGSLSEHLAETKLRSENTVSSSVSAQCWTLSVTGFVNLKGAEIQKMEV